MYISYSYMSLCIYEWGLGGRRPGGERMRNTQVHVHLHLKSLSVRHQMELVLFDDVWREGGEKLQE